MKTWFRSIAGFAIQLVARIFNESFYNCAKCEIKPKIVNRIAHYHMSTFHIVFVVPFAFSKLFKFGIDDDSITN